jgi:hypothetical protein
MPQPKKHVSHAARQTAYRLRCQEARTEEQKQQGLPALPTLPTLPGTARWRSAVGSARLLLETTQAEMQAYFDERTEVWQEGERGQLFLDRLQALESTLSSLDEIDIM